ncbi:MAG: AbrB/MazE/SpoVT family DNA-binding domain-containing protein [Deltaproteobacteria bacterium]|nr:AbrB/MazE/SpoVT family DNA-binding domain-containing protein [Deltaproteobacteria bacterium]
MTLAKVKKRYQITLPLVIRKKFHIAEGDFVDVEERQGGIFLKPVKMISPDQEYFYTKEWQTAEVEADNDIAKGNVSGPFKTVDELFNELDA